MGCHTWCYREAKNKKEYVETNKLTVKFKGKYYIEDTNVHDIFRTTEYPSDILLSEKDTLEFINNKENVCSNSKDINSGKVDLELIKEFWEKFPNGLIEFG